MVPMSKSKAFPKMFFSQMVPDIDIRSDYFMRSCTNDKSG